MAENVQAAKVEYRDDRKIVTHPNGVVSEYPRTVLEGFKQQMLKQKQMFEDQIAAVDKDLAGIDAVKASASPAAPATPAEPAPAEPVAQDRPAAEPAPVAPVDQAPSADSSEASQPAQGSDNAG